MTVLVGILCKDGVVIGADSVGTSSDGEIKTAEWPVAKISVVRERVVVACTGDVGLAQRFLQAVERVDKAKKFDQSKPLDAARAVSEAVWKDFKATGAYDEVLKQDGGGFRVVGTRAGLAAMVGWTYKNEPCLCEFGWGTLQPELKGGNNVHFMALGSGQKYADPFLAFQRRIFMSDGPPRLSTGVFLTTMAIEHVVEVNAGDGVGGVPCLTVIRDKGNGVWRAHLCDSNELAEHHAMVEAAYDHFADFETAFESNPVAVPDV